MILSKVAQKSNITYITLRTANGEWCVITVNGNVTVSMNKDGTSMTIDKEGK